MIKDSLLIALPSDSSLQHYPENEPNDYTVRLASPISLMGRWEAALLEMSFPYEWHGIERAVGVHIISTMAPIQGDLSLLGDLLVTKERKLPEIGWSYEIEQTTGGSNIQFEYNYVEVPSGDYSTQQELGKVLENVVSEALATKYRIFQDEKLFQYRYNMGTRAGQYYIAHESLLVFLVLEYSKLAIALGLTCREVMARIHTPADDEKKSQDEHVKLANEQFTRHVQTEFARLVLPGLSNVDREAISVIISPNNTEGDIVSFVSPEYRMVYFITGNAGESMLRKTLHVHDGVIDSIYVYSDIIELQMVGDTLAPLLGIVPLKTTKRGSRQFFTFTSPIYLPLCKQQFSTIHIRLRTARGKPIPFPENSTNVVCMLHLRRYNPFI